MAESNSSVQSGGIGFLGLLTIVFIALKLMGYIAWSWWWVLSPLWLPLVGLVVTGVIWLVLWLVIWLVTAAVDKSKRDRWG